MILSEYLNSQFSLLQYVDFFARLIAACLCGALIGIERSKRYKGAGIRTHIIVCCAAALMMIVSKYGFADLTSAAGTNFNGTRGADPARVAAQVVSGVSFLGAGVIFKNGSIIKGLTTAAGIWATAGIGLAIGCGMYILGIFATAVIVLIQIIMHRFTFGADALTTSRLQFTVKNTDAFQSALSEFFAKHKVQVVESRKDISADGMAAYDLTVKSREGVSIEELDTLMESAEEVRSVGCVPVV
ncbi:MAG: MgtC/SapB family protein [Clostridia bacterium]|nr:MgtC/SapB family protein [Clostridia bacterium]